MGDTVPLHPLVSEIEGDLVLSNGTMALAADRFQAWAIRLEREKLASGERAEATHHLLALAVKLARLGGGDAEMATDQLCWLTAILLGDAGKARELFSESGIEVGDLPSLQPQPRDPASGLQPPKQGVGTGKRR